MYGEYFRTHPGVRPRVFLSAKTTSRNPVVMQEHLDKALADTGTSCIDFFALHTVDNVGVLTEDIREWAERAKREGKLRFFGFCTHTNMDRCLSDGADLGWIDAIQTFYNYRLRSVRSMEDALQKCHERGIGLIAVKSMALCEQTREELRKLPLNEATLQSLLAVHGMTFEQAKLRAIWQNPALTSVCSLMRSPAMLQSNALAAIDESRLPAEVDQLLSDHAESTARYFCRRCAENCEPVNADRIPICSVMQLLMMARGYEGERDFCAELFRRIPADIREKISTSDYSFAERQCPQGIPIGQLMKDAYLELSR